MRHWILRPATAILSAAILALAAAAPLPAAALLALAGGAASLVAIARRVAIEEAAGQQTR